MSTIADLVLSLLSPPNPSPAVVPIAAAVAAEVEAVRVEVDAAIAAASLSTEDAAFLTSLAPVLAVVVHATRRQTLARATDAARFGTP